MSGLRDRLRDAIHKSQGSQFDTAVVLLPAATSRILTGQLLYTAATRASA